MWLLILLVYVTTVTGKDCIWRSSISSTLPYNQDAHPYQTCRDGELWWFYPRGMIHANFSYEVVNQDFDICLHYHPDHAVDEIRDESMGVNNSVVLPPLSQANKTCVTSVDGYVKLVFTSPQDDSHYLVKIKYTLEPA